LCWRPYSRALIADESKTEQHVTTTTTTANHQKEATISQLTVQQVYKLVTANRAIRSPDYHADRDLVRRQRDAGLKGLQWGADIIPALMGLFRVERAVQDDSPNTWVGFARHWRGETLRLGFDLKSDIDGSDPILVLNTVSGHEEEETNVDKDFGEIELPDEVPTRQEWDERNKGYQAARKADATDGAAAVKAYIAALPGWKREVAARFDEIVACEVPDVRRAIKWHIPFYGLEDQGWFASFGALSKHVKLTFLRGTSLDPVPPVGKDPEGRSLDVRKTDTLDEEQLTSWVRQAAAIPGWGG
jgi:hypothetical protein